MPSWICCPWGDAQGKGVPSSPTAHMHAHDLHRPIRLAAHLHVQHRLGHLWKVGRHRLQQQVQMGKAEGGCTPRPPLGSAPAAQCRPSLHPSGRAAGGRNSIPRPARHLCRRSAPAAQPPHLSAVAGAAAAVHAAATNLLNSAHLQAAPQGRGTGNAAAIQRILHTSATQLASRPAGSAPAGRRRRPCRGTVPARPA